MCSIIYDFSKFRYRRFRLKWPRSRNGDIFFPPISRRSLRGGFIRRAVPFLSIYKFHDTRQYEQQGYTSCVCICVCVCVRKRCNEVSKNRQYTHSCLGRFSSPGTLSRSTLMRPRVSTHTSNMYMRNLREHAVRYMYLRSTCSDRNYAKQRYAGWKSKRSTMSSGKC